MQSAKCRVEGHTPYSFCTLHSALDSLQFLDTDLAIAHELLRIVAPAVDLERDASLVRQVLLVALVLHELDALDPRRDARRVLRDAGTQLVPLPMLPELGPLLRLDRQRERTLVLLDDGHFVREFQTLGFDARTWELYLYAYLNEECLQLDRSYHAPDYVINLGDERICIEAVTVNPTGGSTLGSPEAKIDDISDAEARELLHDFVPIKFGSALYTKLNKKPAYWELDHVSGFPLIFAVADFHAPRSMLWTSTGLQRYLYGYHHKHELDGQGQLVIHPMKIERHRYGDKEIPSGFFFQPGSENVSAVLHSNSGTLSKFSRMGRLAGFEAPGIRTFRRGLRYDHTPNATKPRLFAFEVAPGMVGESWAEGLNMFHNPNSRHPVDPRLFPSIAHHFFESGMVKSNIPDFHPMMSMTFHLGAEGSVQPSGVEAEPEIAVDAGPDSARGPDPMA